jgi:predicted nucleic acid-binding protein
VEEVRCKAPRPLDVKATREIVADYLTWYTVVNASGAVLDLESRHQMSFWHTHVVQATQESGAEVLYSEDMSDRQRYGSLRVTNPFVDSANLPAPA